MTKICDRLRIMTELQLGIAGKFHPDFQDRVARTEPDGVERVLKALRRPARSNESIAHLAMGTGIAGIELDRTLEGVDGGRQCVGQVEREPEIEISNARLRIAPDCV